MKIKGKLKTRLWKNYIPQLIFKVAGGPNKRTCHFQSFPHYSSDRVLIWEIYCQMLDFIICLAACAKKIHFCFFNKGNVY